MIYNSPFLTRLGWYKSLGGPTDARAFLQEGTDLRGDAPCCLQSACVQAAISHRIHGVGIYANIGGILMVNVTIYSIHGSYGYVSVRMILKHIIIYNK